MDMIYVLVGTLLLIGVMGLTFAVMLGKPYGEYTMGGRYRVLPKNMRIVAAMSLFIQLYALAVLLQLGNVIENSIPNNIANYSALFFCAYFVLNTIMNLLSKSKKERTVMSFASLLLVLCYVLLLVGNS